MAGVGGAELAQHAAHALHGVDPAPAADGGAVKVVVEIPAGSKAKYELDEVSGLLALDRVLHSSVTYPAAYGFVPRSLAADGDAADALVFCSVPLVPLCVVRCRVVGVLPMLDNNDKDWKLLCVAEGDPRLAHVREARDLPPHALREAAHFFATYKQLEKNKSVEIGEVQDAAAARRFLLDALREYSDEHRRSKL